jgi:hypothetical protein
LATFSFQKSMHAYTVLTETNHIHISHI